MSGFPAQLVLISGNRGVGKSALLTQLPALLPGYAAAVTPQPVEPGAAGLRAAIDSRFRALAKALEHAASSHQGVVVEGTTYCETVLVQHELLAFTLSL